MLGVGRWALSAVEMKIVLAYSGGLDTSVILRWLKDNYQAEIIAFCADIGQEDELSGLEEKAMRTGASKCYIDNLQEEFARDFIFPMFQAGAIYEGQYLLGTAIARPLIAKRMVEIARKEGANVFAHGATGKGNDQVRFELAAAALAPDLKVVAPWRDERFRKQFPGRAEMMAFAKANGIPVEASAEKPYSMDRNLLHISYESGVLEDPWFDASSSEMRGMYKLSAAPEDAPDKPEQVDLEFENGDCINLSGGTRAVVSQNSGADSAAPSMTPLGVMKTLNQLGGRHGIGRVDIVENRFVGMKSRGVYETPGGAILHFAHRQMESLSASGFYHRNATRRYRRGPAQTLQRQYDRRWPQKPKESLRSKDRDHGRHGVGLRSKRCNRFHSAKRIAIKTADAPRLRVGEAGGVIERYRHSLVR
jgi:argininosuccinate synthase